MGSGWRQHKEDTESGRKKKWKGRRGANAEMTLWHLLNLAHFRCSVLAFGDPAT